MQGRYLSGHLIEGIEWDSSFTICYLLKKRTFEELFLQFGLCDLDFDGLVDLLLMPTFVDGVVLDSRGKKGVDESSFAQS